MTNIVSGELGRLAVAFNDAVEQLAAFHPGWSQLLTKHLVGLGVILVLIEIKNFRQHHAVLSMQTLEVVEVGPVFTFKNSAAIVIQFFVQAVFVAGVQLAVFVGQVTLIKRAHQLQGQDIAVDPGATNHRTVIDPGNRVGLHLFFTGFDRQQARVRRNNHQQHNGDDYSKARQDALA